MVIDMSGGGQWQAVARFNLRMVDGVYTAFGSMYGKLPWDPGMLSPPQPLRDANTGLQA